MRSAAGSGACACRAGRSVPAPGGGGGVGGGRLGSPGGAGSRRSALAAGARSGRAWGPGGRCAEGGPSISVWRGGERCLWSRDGFGHLPTLPPGPTGRKLVPKGRGTARVQRSHFQTKSNVHLVPRLQKEGGSGAGGRGSIASAAFPSPRLVGVNRARPAVPGEGRRWPVSMGILSSPWSLLLLQPPAIGAWGPWWVRVRRPSAVRAQGAEEAGALRGHRPRAAGVPPGAGRALGRFGEEWLPSSRRGALRALIWETTTSSYRGLFPAFGGLAPEPSCCLQCAQDQASVTACDPGTCTRFPPLVIGAGAGRGWVKAHWFPCVPLLPLHLGRPGSKEVRGQGGGERSGWR